MKAMAWLDDAACAGKDPLLWHPEHTGGTRQSPSVLRSLYAPARAICDTCPVEAECGEYAIDAREKEGMWGGLDPVERQTIARPRKRKAPDCGTDAGYKQHRRLGEDACDDCRGAHRRYRTPSSVRSVAS